MPKGVEPGTGRVGGGCTGRDVDVDVDVEAFPERIRMETHPKGVEPGRVGGGCTGRVVDVEACIWPACPDRLGVGMVDGG